MQNNLRNPKISVVMGVYNGQRYLREAIESILDQTFKNFEFLIVDDGSTDKTTEILKEYAKRDKRIKVIANKKNIGLTKSLNKLILLAKGEYIARMDADDISRPKRLERQFKILEEKPEIAVASCWYFVIDKDGRVINLRRPPQSSTELKKLLLMGINPICHSTVLVRKALLEKVGLYRTKFRYSQDYDLWLRMINKYKFYVMPEVLHKFRLSLENAWKENRQTYSSLTRKCYKDPTFYKKMISPKGKIKEISSKNKKILYHYLKGIGFLEADKVYLARKEFKKGLSFNPFSGRIYSRYLLSFLPRKKRTRIIKFVKFLRRIPIRTVDVLRLPKHAA